MKFVFAPDSFKGSLAAARVCQLLAQAAREHFPDAELDLMPVADGGEGTVEALVLATGGRLETVRVTGPLGEKDQALWGVLGDGNTVVLEMAQASGLPLVPIGKRNPLLTTSYGTGEMIAHALNQGFRKIVIGLGGSATNDGGMGMLTALGAQFLDASGEPLMGTGRELGNVAQVRLEGLLPALKEATITVLSDVTNPLLGANGATMVYGPQKGASAQALQALEAGMARYAVVLEEALQKDIHSFPGAGAAGGMGAALGGVLGAVIKPGISAVLDMVGFDRRVRGASLVITGEGKMDEQSVLFGKAAAGVAKRCAAQFVPVIAVVGGMADGAKAFLSLEKSSIMTAVNGVMDVSQAMDHAEALLLDAADRMFRMLRIGAMLAP